MDNTLIEEVLENQLSSSEHFNHLEELERISEEDGKKCMRGFWSTPYPNGSHCNATWDTLFCWPTTPANHVVSVPCDDIIRVLNPRLGYNNAQAYRVCDPSGHWLWGNWTNYTECTDLLDRLTEPMDRDATVTVVSYIGFIGSLMSLVSLTIALFIFCYFKSLQCSRLSLHKNLVVSFIIRFILMVIVTEPTVTGRRDTFMNVEWLCKFILAAKMYSMVSNVNWMFVEGFYLHSRITVSVFNSDAPFGLFYTIGWGLPLVYVLVWAVVLQSNMTNYCWLGYSKTPYIWIIAAPMSLALLINLIFLVNIVRILVTKLRANNSVEHSQISSSTGSMKGATDALQGRTDSMALSRTVTSLLATRKAIKATAVLFPLLGTTNLLFFVNPKDDGQLEDAYIIINSILQSSQGIFVSILYCFLNSEVRSAVRKKYVRFMLQKNPTNRRFTKRKYSRTSSFFLSQCEIWSTLNLKPPMCLDIVPEIP